MAEAHADLSSPSLRDVALAAVASLCAGGDTAPEMRFLEARREQIGAGRRWAGALLRALEQPAADDEALLQLAARLGLCPVEVLAVALAATVETDLMTGRAIAHVQAPVGGSRPTLGLVDAAFSDAAGPGATALERILGGPAVATGLLRLLGDGAPSAERPVTVPLELCLALRGRDATWAGATILPAGVEDAVLPSSAREATAREALALASGGGRALAVRSTSAAEGRAVAAAIAAALGMRAVVLEEGAPTAGLGPWLLLRRLVPAFSLQLGPGERKSIAALPGYDGPVLTLCGLDGGVEVCGGSAPVFTVRTPTPDERRILWTAATASPRLSQDLARRHRHGSGRILQLGRLARHRAALDGRSTVEAADVRDASWVAEGPGLDTLAQPLPESIPDAALVTTTALRRQLERLYERCIGRDGLADGLGPSAVARYHPGVRALFTGPSGTGKTLAAGWLATRLGLPLYRVDLAAVTSKYIGETEKNLALLLARAEHGEVVLLFDEADALFARRTEVSDANDRFANAQTNYLLQRIETFDGIAILTANSRARFDTAFARRLDVIVEFALPGPEERRALWEAHLGSGHIVARTDLNRLAVLADLAGGGIRNAVLAAAVLAKGEGRAIAYADVVEGAAEELRKVGKPVPVELVGS